MISDEFFCTSLYVSENDWECVVFALSALQKDFETVGCKAPEIFNDPARFNGDTIIAGTLGKCPIIDSLAAEGKINASNIKGKRESYVMEEIENFENIGCAKRALVVVGSDKRGTVYGIYKISEMLGVSPWVWWADSVPKKQESFAVPKGFRLEQGEPSVKFRGFFMNDEAPSLTGWVEKCFGKVVNPEASPGYNSNFYAKVFELLLRLKGNYFWPVMWNNSFHTDDPENTALAERYGIVMGTSHHEHMTCADKEWTWANRGDWNYATNRDEIYKFWHEGVEARQKHESIITLGMRGQADTSILGPFATLRDNTELLQNVVDDQREIISNVYGNSDAVPQMLALYKEVEGFYYGDGTGEKGEKLEVPEDVTLMLCDDNYGNLRTLPTEEMLKRSGGFGIYYHFDYRGGPISYEWINQTPLPKIWDNMTEAYDAGIREIWIVNVGDLKPMELPLDYFMSLAYDFENWSAPNKTAEFTKMWAAREFGEEFADDAAAVLNGYTKILGARKAEVVLSEPSTFSLFAFDEATCVLSEFEAIVAKAEAVCEKLPAEKKPAFFQLALYPARAAMNTYKTNICAAWSLWYAKNNLPKANVFAKMAKEAFEADARDTEYFNKELSGGKWDGIMRQNHMGYTAWDTAKIFPVPNEMPKTGESTVKDGAAAAEHWYGNKVMRSVQKLKPSVFPENLPTNTYIEANGYVSINPARFTNNTPAQGAQFTVINDYGRDGDSVKVLPTGIRFATDSNAPMLEYGFYINLLENYTVNIFLAPSNPPRNASITPMAKQLRFSVQIDETERKTVCGLPEGKFLPGISSNWGFGVMDNVRIISVSHGRLFCGFHTLRIFAVDPGIVIQKIVIALSFVEPKVLTKNPLTTHFMNSYFGPPESFYTS